MSSCSGVRRRSNATGILYAGVLLCAQLTACAAEPPPPPARPAAPPLPAPAVTPSPPFVWHGAAIMRHLAIGALGTKKQRKVGAVTFAKLDCKKDFPTGSANANAVNDANNQMNKIATITTDPSACTLGDHIKIVDKYATPINQWLFKASNASGGNVDVLLDDSRSAYWPGK